MSNVVIKKRLFGASSFGWAELLVVMYPILSGYNYGLPLGTVILFLCAIFMFVRRPKVEKNIWLIAFTLFYLFHELILFTIVGKTDSAYLNNTLERVLSLFSILLIVPHLDWEKFYGALVIVTIVCVFGLFYQVFQVLVLHQTISTITLPFMPKLEDSSNVWLISERPRSFFLEPAAYATFMFVPLSIALARGQISFALIITFSILASTSSNGFFQSAIIWSVYLLTSKELKTSRKLFLAIIMLLSLVWVLRSPIFEAGREKIEGTEFDDNVRVTAGANLFTSLEPSEMLLGIPNLSIYDYLMEQDSGDYKIEIGEASVFMPAFWWYLIKMGIIGGALFLMLYAQFFKVRPAIPYVCTCLAGSMVQSLGVIFPIIILLMFKKHYWAHNMKCENE